MTTDMTYQRKNSVGVSCLLAQPPFTGCETPLAAPFIFRSSFSGEASLNSFSNKGPRAAPYIPQVIATDEDGRIRYMVTLDIHLLCLLGNRTSLLIETIFPLHHLLLYTHRSFSLRKTQGTS
ncbi:hypothetical protein N7G274_008131 [Stereocaulon virgatum]|uniref:Uncharacterized protein n=1 Tax=Stereocaulon virgatum TaxID=373712 RepID=A0ABR3ZZG5_9LECA